MKTTRLWAICLLSACVFCACGTSAKGEKDMLYTKGFAMDNKSGELTAPRQLDLPRFNGIAVNGSTVINYTVGSKCSVTMSCTKGSEDQFEIYVKNNILVVTPKGYTLDKVKIVLDVTAPLLNKVFCNGVTNFNAPLVKGDNMTFTMNGCSTVNVDKLDCKEIDISCSGASKLEKMKVTANKMDLFVSGASKAELGYKGKNAKVNICGASKIGLDVDCDDLLMESSGASALDIKSSADKMDFTMSGASKAELDYKGKNAKVNICGASKITLDVDCEDLQMESSGGSKIVVKGCADKTDIKSHGASTIDNTGLNQY